MQSVHVRLCSGARLYRGEREDTISARTYKDAGVDIDAGNALVEAIKPLAKRTLRPEVLTGIGGFGALVEVSKKYREPVLVASTDGVGTKVAIAQALDVHDTADRRQVLGKNCRRRLIE